MSFIAIEALAVAAAMPVVVHQLGGVRLYGWAFSSFLLAQLGGIVIGGTLVSRVGLGKPLIVAMVGFVIGLVICGTAPTMVIVVVGRSVQGAAAGLVEVSLNVAVGRMFPPGLQARVYAALSGAWVVPGVVGPALAGEVAGTIGWRWVFLGIIPAVGAAAAIASPSMFQADHEWRSDRTTEADAAPMQRFGPVALRALGLAVGSGLVLGAVGESRLEVALTLLPVGVVLAIPALLHGGKGSEPVTKAAIGIGAFMCMAFFGVEAFVPLTITAIHHRSVVEAAPVLTVAAFTWSVGSWLQAKWSERGGVRLMCLIGMACIVVGIGVMTAVTFAKVPWWYSFVAWSISGLGTGFCYPTVNLVILQRTEQGSPQAVIRGERVAAMNVWLTLGAAFGTGIGGAVLSWSVVHGHGDAPGVRWFDVFALAVSLAGLLWCIALPGPEKQEIGAPL
jgi:MFS family permease